MKYIKSKFSVFYVSFFSLLTPAIARADIQGMMRNLQTAILEILAPIMCIGGIIFSGIKLATGDESGKRMLFWSCIASVIVFSAPSLFDFLKHRVAA